ncbi:transketolase family protein [candidate division KSB3 bacterium]|uniref:Transketolase family protein n=1 Tax=candidate division KSB3 bacterium TaxID=2044937 RepID=A0A9D5Q5A8_9BACT|nr:transketolase family protein [candidate division KSB3 bacterium]MBD3324629.1 transketolase family protein [candidate division KSB3 bacterium]
MKLGKAPRIAYGETLLELAKTNPDIVALDGDLSKSTMTCLLEEHFPERFFEMSIAEQNMVATAAGMALKGKVPFVNSFAVFMTGRAFDQIRQSVAYPVTNVKICGSSSGFSDFGDGATHQSIEDLALMRALPHMIVLSPLDEIETREMVKFMVAHDGPVYIRLDRNELPILLPEDYQFTLGQPTIIREGSDVTVFATGRMVSLALEAANTLDEEGISAEVVNIGTIKPMHTEAIVHLASKTRAVVTAEEHNIYGGLGSAIAETLMKTKVPIVPIGVKDQFGQSAHSFEELLAEYGLTADAIYDAAKEVLTVK